ncbi:MAG: 50S ribosomal protein L10 [Dehalococcoidia bacterium]|nr:MAG: 50S ribosomal protein L10 [Dehalococcoidia bacterium]
MLRKQKESIINELAEDLGKCAIAIATDYRGLTAKDMVSLRKQMHLQGVDYKVVKNTLAHLAAEKAGVKGLDPLLVGPLAIALGYDDVVKPAKILADAMKIPGSALKIKGGVMGDKVLSAAEISSLASIPSKEILISMLLGNLKSPITSLHFVLSSPLRGLACVLQARAKQLEGG